MTDLQRTSALLIALAVPLCAQDLRIRKEADQLRATANNLRFIGGHPLEQMRNGGTVAFDFNLTLLDSMRNVIRRSFERFVISYDLWEERFSVTRLRSARTSASRLSESAAQSWCLDNISILSSGLPDQQQFTARLDISVQQNRPEEDRSDGLPLSTLIDLFGRAAKKQGPQHWRMESAPIRLRELRQNSGRTGA